jgi:uncharacterized membrane protein
MERIFYAPHDAFGMRALIVCVVVGLLLVGAVGPVSAQSTATSDAETAMTIDLGKDGDARWRIETRLPLNSTNETRGFRQFGQDYVAGETSVDYSMALFRAITDRAEAKTGRPMAITNVSRSWHIVEGNATTNATGRLAVAFTWKNFTRVEDGSVVLGDVFETEPRWLAELGANQTLSIRAPGNYYVASANTGHENATLRWEGPTTFDSGEFEARFARSGGPRFELPGTIPWSGIAAIVATVVIAALAYRLTRRRGQPGADGPTPSETEPVAEPPSDDGEDADPFADVDETLLSDEERIERHLEAAGGRMKQAKIVERTGWSNAKVSQVLSGMAEEGRIEKLRIGRENLISLPEEDSQH